MKAFKRKTTTKTLGLTAVAPFLLIGCNGGHGSTSSTSSTSTSVLSMAASSNVTVVAPIFNLKNNSAANANCSYYITTPDGEPYGQTPIIAGSNIKSGSGASWTYTDTMSFVQNSKSVIATTKTAICSYNQGWGPLGPSSEEGAYYIEHDTTNNTVIFTGYGLSSSKTSVSCLNANGKQVSQLLTNDNYSTFTCYLNSASPSITITMAGSLSNGTNLMNQQVNEQDTESFTAGIGAEATNILDNNTGLMWVKDLNTVPVVGSSTGSQQGYPAATSYQNALATIAQMNKANFGGHNDWRLPSINEMSSLINYTSRNPQVYLLGEGFANLAPGDGDYWTGTSFAPNQEAPWAGYNWISMMSDTGKGRTSFSVGVYSQDVAQPSALYVWPVRTTAATTTANTPVLQTGEKASVGKAWPSPRFVPDKSGQCMTDKLTGFTWVKNQAALQTVGGSRVLAVYKDAKATVDRMNVSGFCGVQGWHLPSNKELGSLANYTKPDFAAWLNSQGFTMHNAGNYWNSFWTGDFVSEQVTPGYPARVWRMNSDQELTFGIQSDMLNVFPVTSAQVKGGAPLPTPVPTTLPTQPQKYPAGIGGYTVGTVVLGRDNKQYTCLVEAACNYAYSDSYYDPVVGEWASFAWSTTDTTASKYPYFPQGIGSYIVGSVVINANGDYFKCLDKQFCNLGDSYDTPVDQFPNNMTWKKVSAADLTPKLTPSPVPTVSATPVPVPTEQYADYRANAGNYVKGTMVTQNGNQYRCLVADYCNSGQAFYAPATGDYAKTAWDLVNYKIYAANTVYPTYPSGQSTYTEGDVVVVSSKQYRCINTASCRGSSSYYSPVSGSYASSAWSPVNNIAFIYPSGIGGYNIGDVVIGNNGSSYRCKDRSSCNYNNAQYYDPVNGAYTSTAWTKIN